MANFQRDPLREQVWRERVAAWSKSRLSIRQFCRQHKLSEASFHFWRRELRTRSEASSPAKSKFIPLTVIPPRTIIATKIEVRCPSGHVVSVPMNDAQTLRQLFEALATPAKETQPC